jgi:hypothetical protein
MLAARYLVAAVVFAALLCYRFASHQPWMTESEPASAEKAGGKALRSVALDSASTAAGGKASPELVQIQHLQRQVTTAQTDLLKAQEEIKQHFQSGDLKRQLTTAQTDLLKAQEEIKAIARPTGGGGGVGAPQKTAVSVYRVQKAGGQWRRDVRLQPDGSVASDSCWCSPMDGEECKREVKGCWRRPPGTAELQLTWGQSCAESTLAAPASLCTGDGGVHWSGDGYTLSFNGDQQAWSGVQTSLKPAAGSPPCCPGSVMIVRHVGSLQSVSTLQELQHSTDPETGCPVSYGYVSPPHWITREHPLVHPDVHTCSVADCPAGTGDFGVMREGMGALCGPDVDWCVVAWETTHIHVTNLLKALRAYAPGESHFLGFAEQEPAVPVGSGSLFLHAHSGFALSRGARAKCDMSACGDVSDQNNGIGMAQCLRTCGIEPSGVVGFNADAPETLGRLCQAETYSWADWAKLNISCVANWANQSGGVMRTDCDVDNAITYRNVPLSCYQQTYQCQLRMEKSAASHSGATPGGDVECADTFEAALKAVQIAPTSESTSQARTSDFLHGLPNPCEGLQSAVGALFSQCKATCESDELCQIWQWHSSTGCKIGRKFSYTCQHSHYHFEGARTHEVTLKIRGSVAKAGDLSVDYRIDAARVALAGTFPICRKRKGYQTLVRHKAHALGSADNEPGEGGLSVGQQALYDLLTDNSAVSYFFWQRAVSFDMANAGHTIAKRECGGAPLVPIIVIVNDRLASLRELIRSVHENILTPFEIILHDMGSAYPPTLRFLDAMEKAGMRVFRTPAPAVGAAEHPGTDSGVHLMLQSVGTTVDTVMKESKSEFYVVTDPDISLTGSPHGNMLHVAASVLQALPQKQVVGPSIRVDDIPTWSAVGDQVGDVDGGYEWGMWPNKLGSFKFGQRRVYWCEHCQIDTTFGIRRKGPFARLSGEGSRLMAPYNARHVDWYYDSAHIPPDHEFYLCQQRLKKSAASHSGKTLGSDVNCADVVAEALKDSHQRLLERHQ